MQNDQGWRACWAVHRWQLNAQRDVLCLHSHRDVSGEMCSSVQIHSVCRIQSIVAGGMNGERVASHHFGGLSAWMGLRLEDMKADLKLQALQHDFNAAGNQPHPVHHCGLPQPIICPARVLPGAF